MKAVLCDLCGQAMRPTIDDDDLVILEWRCPCGHRELPILPQQEATAGQQRPDMVIYLPQPIEVVARILQAAPADARHMPSPSTRELRIVWGHPQ